MIVVGDHSEAFGQHPGNWTHGRATYEENIRVPALIWQPALFKPRRVKVPTTHVDVLPTVLDGLNIRYNEKLFQGESLFQKELRRKYIFIFGNENTLSSITKNKIKMQYSFKSNSCWVFNLKDDPAERRRLNCRNYPDQLRALLKYQKFQKKMLRSYNQRISRNLSYFGKRHPLIYGKR